MASNNISPVVGTWELVSWESRDSGSGSTSSSIGPLFIGRIIYTHDGYVAATIMRDRPPPLGVDPENLRKHRWSRMRPDRIRAVYRYLKAASNFVSYSGRYRLDGNVILHYVDVSLLPEWIGTVLKRPWSLEGDRLVLRAETNAGSHVLTWRRLLPNNQSPRIAVVGGGSIGGIVAGLLADAGHHVEMVDTNSEHVDAVNHGGLRIEGVQQLTVRPRACRPEEIKGKVDMLLLAVKATHTKEALTPLLPLLAADGVVAVLQNGLTGEDVAHIAGPGRVVEVAIGWGATYQEPGLIHRTSFGNFVLGEVDGVIRPRTHCLADLLKHVAPVEISRDIIGHKWSKLLINASMSGTGTLCGLRYGEILSHPYARKVALAALTEGADVARGLGIKLGKLDGRSLHFLISRSRTKRFLAEIFIRIGMRRYHDLKASMWQDLEKSLPTEIDLLNGFIVKKGLEAGVPTPVNQAIATAIRQMETGELSPDVAHLNTIPLPHLPFF